ncbi:DUF930 domain-containing protein [Stappia sp. MMSF_3263]|uniref:DUF930 domain-containing protein n=1 Tax=Stappia sp. MMSF_3263 TaxID=3046693 RepID=UPI0027401E7B|nr:DUF930 domain-containing protein [Stappia sp. MMSF_3263]
MPVPVSVSVPVSASMPVAGRGEPGADVGAMPQAEMRGADDRLPARGPGTRGGGGIALSLMLHVAVAWAVFFGGDSVRELRPFLDEPVEVVLVDFPAAEEAVQEEQEEEAVPEEETPEEQETEEEADAAAPPPLPENEQAEAEPPAVEEPEEEKPEIAKPEVAALPEPAVPPQATPRVLIPVTEFAEEDGGSSERAGETGLREGIEETPEAARDEVSSQAEAGEGVQGREDAAGAPAGEGTEDGLEEGREDEGDTGGLADAAEEDTAGQSEAVQASGEQAEADANAATDAEVADAEAAGIADALAEAVGEPDVLAVPGEGPGEVAAPASGLPPADTRARPREKPAEFAAPAAAGERIDLAALADLGARAEAVSRALATRRRAGGGGEGGGGGEIAGGTTATRLFSRDLSDDPRMRTAMNGMPQAARVDLLCMTELRAQLRTATPPYHADLLPSFRFEAGNVLQPRRAAFRAGGQWYELAFRCELNAGVTRVESFTHRVGEPVPRAEWSTRGFPGN